MASLLARLPRPRRALAGGRGWPLPLPWLTAAATVAVSVVGLLVLGAAIVVVQTLDPSGGLSVGGSAVLAGRMWLLAEGGSLRVSSGPIVLAPLLLTLAIGWGLSSAARWVARARDVTSTRAATALAGLVVVVHVVATALLALPVDGGDARVGWLRTLGGAAVLAVLAAGWGAGRESGVLDMLSDRLPGTVRPLLRAVLAGLLTATALCLAVVAVAVASDAHGYAALNAALGGAGAGAVGLLGLGVLLLPNAAAAVLGLAAGPGFVVGSATVVSVHGVTLGAVPALPLLAALPDTQAVPLLAFLSQAVPALAGLVTGVTLGRRLGEQDGGSVVAGLLGAAAGIGLGVAGGLVVWVAGGSLGNGALAEIGAPAVATGIAVAAQSGIAAVLAAAVTRWRTLG